MKKHSIFKGSGDWRYTVGVNYPHHAHELMTEGYLRAAQRLCGSIANNPNGVDFLVYPLIFLYRHWFELRLKDIINQGRQLIDQQNGHPHSHSLRKLWSEARDLITKVWSDSDEPVEFALIEKAVNEFETFDASSQTFRYPTGKNGKSTLVGLKEVNLEHFSKNMEKVADFLDAASMGLEAYLEAQNDMRFEAYESGLY